jgi:hypothetical protein
MEREKMEASPSPPPRCFEAVDLGLDKDINRIFNVEKLI